MSEILKGLTLLYVEDDELTGSVLLRKLKQVFKEVYFSPEGADALERIKRVKPDIIVTDLGMPVLDGYSLMDKITEMNIDIPVVVTTAFPDDKVENLNAEAILFKPVKIRELTSILEEIAINRHLHA